MASNRDMASVMNIKNAAFDMNKESYNVKC